MTDGRFSDVARNSWPGGRRSFDANAFLFALAIAVVSGVISGSLPHCWVPEPALGGNAERRRPQFFVSRAAPSAWSAGCCGVALALVLLIGAGLW